MGENLSESWAAVRQNQDRADDSAAPAQDLHALDPSARTSCLVPPPTRSATTLLEGEDDHAIDAALAPLSGRLLRHLADRVGTSSVAGQAMVQLHFEH